MGVELNVLGEVGVLVDGVPVDLGPPKQRSVLAALAVDVNAWSRWTGWSSESGVRRRRSEHEPW